MVKRELYDLIKSMTMSEKRYFKIYSSKHVIGGKNEYVSLFDAIDKQEAFDDEQLKKYSFVKNLSAEKNYLHKLILKSLVAFNSKLNTKVKVTGLLQNAEVLYHKGLYKQAEKQCKKALKLTDKYELFAHKMAVLELLIELLSKQFHYQESIDVIEQGRKEAIQLNNFIFIQDLTMQAYRDQWDIGAARSSEESQVIKSYLDKLNTSGYVPDSKRAEMYILGLELTHAFYVNDLKKMNSISIAMNELYESNLHLIEYSTIGYISSLYNTGWSYVLSGNLNEALLFAEKLDGLKEKYGIATSFNKGARVFFYSRLIYLDALLKLDRYSDVEKLMDSTFEGIETFTPYIGAVHLYELYFLIAKYYFVVGNYRMALKYTNNILNDRQFKTRKDLLAVVHLLNLLVHFEMGNDFTLEYLTKNTYNYFKSKDRLFKVEKELIRFISGRNRDLHNEMFDEDLIQLRDAMRAHKKDPYEISPFNHFDFEYWAQSKIDGKRLEAYEK
ncbi:hypothetical protein [Parvicella tangerina]|uniref:Tetratricopeptide repeat protein n=1 Tax=Parvicella tangerina TaxID=2829795 RepID=A0A916JLA8_9FLAO|nr:hypothetical protein [Parvicella tangerina]CAG5077381.1 hypothetical protein CRYO30217_00366 [Parvicella tangerina]